MKRLVITNFFMIEVFIIFFDLKIDFPVKCFYEEEMILSNYNIIFFIFERKLIIVITMEMVIGDKQVQVTHFLSSSYSYKFTDSGK